jgi:hypothetical protein
MNRAEMTDIWNKAVGVTKIYCVAEQYHYKEPPGFANCIKQMAFSMSDSIADGASKKNTTDILHCMAIARRTAAVLARQLHVALSMQPFETNKLLLGEVDGISNALDKLASGWRVKDAV